MTDAVAEDADREGFERAHASPVAARARHGVVDVRELRRVVCDAFQVLQKLLMQTR